MAEQLDPKELVIIEDLAGGGIGEDLDHSIRASVGNNTKQPPKRKRNPLRADRRNHSTVLY